MSYKLIPKTSAYGYAKQQTYSNQFQSYQSSKSFKGEYGNEIKDYCC